MHCVVTGGAGFVGSHLVEILVKNGHVVTVFDIDSNAIKKNLKTVKGSIEIINQDINIFDFKHISKPIDAIAHLSAIASVPQSWSFIRASHDANLTSTATLIELASLRNIPRIVFASSAAVYGAPQALPLEESAPKLPLSPYGFHKLASEEYLRYYCQTLPLSCFCLRLFNVFGPRQNPDSSYTGVITKFIQNLSQSKALTLFGDGNQTRDFVHVLDVARAFYQALTINTKKHTWHAVNIGSGTAISILDLAKDLLKYFPEAPQNIHFEASRPGDIKHSLASIQHATDLLGFKPTLSLKSSLQELIKNTPY